jgi:hypothetical protein
VTITALYDLINLKNRNNVNSCPDTGICNKKTKKETKQERKSDRKKETTKSQTG